MPLASKRPICETSNKLTLFLVLTCSSIIPEYCKGISHPWKSTILAPYLTCKSYNGVLTMFMQYQVTTYCFLRTQISERNETSSIFEYSASNQGVIVILDSW